eukprot:4337318-Alexandrium_andersonii.AAC.1
MAMRASCSGVRSETLRMTPLSRSGSSSFLRNLRSRPSKSDLAETIVLRRRLGVRAHCRAATRGPLLRLPDL